MTSGKTKPLSAKMRFLVQEHHARQLHYDFRLEMAGVLKSWALPKGPSLNPADRRLAIMVEDHDLEYYGFEGMIPNGHYGAGPVVVWDQGNYILVEDEDPIEALERGKLSIEIHGKILKGGFSLIQMKGQGDKNWLLIKKEDDYSQDNWTLPQALKEEKEGALAERVPPCKAH
jgi:bifunctional non-homologous end joining protein LigD